MKSGRNDSSAQLTVDQGTAIAGLAANAARAIAPFGANPRAAQQKPVRNQAGAKTHTYKDTAEDNGYPALTFCRLKPEQEQAILEDPPVALITTNAFNSLPKLAQAIIVKAGIPLAKSEKVKKEAKAPSPVGAARSQAREFLTMEMVKELLG